MLILSLWLIPFAGYYGQVMPRLKALNNLLSCDKERHAVSIQGALSSGTSVAISRISITMAMARGYSMGTDLKIDEKVGALTNDSSPLKRRPRMPARHERGTTLVEVAVAGALLVLELASLYALYGTTVKEAKAGDTAAIAEQNCIARIDQIRNLTWNNTTDPSTDLTHPSSIANLLRRPTSSDNASTISGEFISVYPAAVPQTSPTPAPTPSASPTPGSTPYFSVTTIGTGTPAISPSVPSSILGERLIRVEVTTEWVTSGTTHQRQLSTLISKSGTKTR